MTTYLLVCEGSCNPWLSSLDQAAGEMRNGRISPHKDKPLLKVPFELKHTPHEPTARRNCYRCEVCGTERKYGDG